MDYIVTKNADGEFTGFCSAAEFHAHRDLYLLEDETYEAFVGPEADGTDETFEVVKQLAHAQCISAAAPRRTTSTP